MSAVVLSGGHILGSASGIFNIGSGSGYDGSLQILASGQIANSQGTPLMLRGFNAVGFDAQITGGMFTSNRFWAANPWGATGQGSGALATGSTGPSYPAMALWNPNIIRIGVNPQAFANYSPALPVWGGSVAASTWSSTNSPQAMDPNGTYKQFLLDHILGVRSINCASIISVAYTAPQFTLGGVTNWIAAVDQAPFLDYDGGYPFWCGTDPTKSFPAWLATNFGSASFNTANGYNGGAAGTYYNPAYGGSTGINDFIFELFNEPYLTNQAFTFYEDSGGTQSGTLAPATPSGQLNGNLLYTTGAQYTKLIGGWCTWFYQQGTTIAIPAAFTSPPNSNPSNPGGLAGALALSWRILGYQPALNAIRANGFTNIIQVNSDSFASSYQELPYIYPQDTLSPPQVSLGNHPYPTAFNSNTSYPKNSDVSTASQWATYSNELLAGTLSVTAPSWTTGWTAGRVVPIVMDEWGDTSGVTALNPSQYIQVLTAYADSKTKGLVHPVCFGWQGPTPNGDTGGPYDYTVAIFGSTITCTGSIATGTPAVLTVTSTPTSPLQAGMQLLTSGGAQAGYIIKQLTGAAGGIGTYSFSISSAVGSQTLSFALPGPFIGAGLTIYNWMQPHGN
jgi:hypothetical protein